MTGLNWREPGDFEAADGSFYIARVGPNIRLGVWPFLPAGRPVEWRWNVVGLCGDSPHAARLAGGGAASRAEAEAKAVACLRQIIEDTLAALGDAGLAR